MIDGIRIGGQNCKLYLFVLLVLLFIPFQPRRDRLTFEVSHLLS